MRFAAANARLQEDLGHMMVAAIAYEQLTPAIRTRVDALLKLNPYYATWQSRIPQSLPASERAASIFMLA